MKNEDLKALCKLQRELQQSDFSGCNCGSESGLWKAFSETFNRNLLEAYDSVDNDAKNFLMYLINKAASGCQDKNKPNEK